LKWSLFLIIISWQAMRDLGFRLAVSDVSKISGRAGPVTQGNNWFDPERSNAV
jgi:hypothetical protein